MENEAIISSPGIAGLGFDDLSATRGNPGSEDLPKVLEQFESLFLTMLLKEARKASSGSELLPRSSMREHAETMFDSMLAKEIARTGGTGIASMLQHQLGVGTGSSHHQPDAEKSP